MQAVSSRDNSLFGGGFNVRTVDYGVLGRLDDFVVYNGFAVDVRGARFSGAIVVGLFSGLVVGVLCFEGNAE